MIRVVIADDHPIVLQAVETLLGEQDDIQVVGVCQGGQSAIDTVRQLSPDILVLDLGMPHVDGIAVMERMRAEGSPTRVVVFTGNMDDRRALECLRLEAAGVVLKELPPEMLLQAIRKVAAGDVWLEKKSHAQAISRVMRRQESKETLAHILTGRELEIFELVAQGWHNRDVAQHLHITEGTVKLHLHHVFGKLGLQGRAELIRYAHQTQIV